MRYEKIIIRGDSMSGISKVLGYGDDDEKMEKAHKGISSIGIFGLVIGVCVSAFSILIGLIIIFISAIVVLNSLRNRNKKE
jgi:hypothetical protein